MPRCVICPLHVSQHKSWSGLTVKCMVSCRVVIIPAHQVLSPCVANLPSLSHPQEAEGMTQRFRTNETRLQDLQQTAILSRKKGFSWQFKFAPLKMNMMMLLTPGMMYGGHNPRWWRWCRPLAPAQSPHLSHYGDSGAMMA